MKNNSINKLVEHLQNIYALPSHTHTLLTSQKPNQSTLRHEMSKNYRQHWRTNGIVHDGMEVKRLPIGDLDNWEILRINMAKRSYQYPKKYKGMKIPAVSKQFNTFNGRGQNGQIPYLYESDIPKLEHIRERMYTKPFKRTNTVKHEAFGFQPKVLPRSRSLALGDPVRKESR